MSLNRVLYGKTKKARKRNVKNREFMRKTCRGGGIGRRTGLKILRWVTIVRVRPPSSALCFTVDLLHTTFNTLRFVCSRFLRMHVAERFRSYGSKLHLTGSVKLARLRSLSRKFKCQHNAPPMASAGKTPLFQKPDTGFVACCRTCVFRTWLQSLLRAISDPKLSIV